SNALVEASYKLTLQEQRFLLLCISRLKSGADAELQKTMTITASEKVIRALASPLAYCARYWIQRNSSRFSSFLRMIDLSHK
ncbi:replication initiation protein, partial [Escherichia coli]|uniref:replication initiation protein n=1 Tax=Escherichia coli TaxID=562 RepID=UPI003EDF8C0E